MSVLRTFKIIKWDDLPQGTPTVLSHDLMCVCGREALCPVADVGVNIESRVGMAFTTDPATPPPPFWMPEEIKCRRCGRIFSIRP